jgi:hypothetical protein
VCSTPVVVLAESERGGTQSLYRARGNQGKSQTSARICGADACGVSVGEHVRASGSVTAIDATKGYDCSPSGQIHGLAQVEGGRKCETRRKLCTTAGHQLIVYNSPQLAVHGSDWSSIAVSFSRHPGMIGEKLGKPYPISHNTAPRVIG